MKRFKVSQAVTTYYTVTVEAEDEDHALALVSTCKDLAGVALVWEYQDKHYLNEGDDCYEVSEEDAS